MDVPVAGSDASGIPQPQERLSKMCSLNAYYATAKPITHPLLRETKHIPRTAVRTPRGQDSGKNKEISSDEEETSEGEEEARTTPHRLPRIASDLTPTSRGHTDSRPGSRVDTVVLPPLSRQSARTAVSSPLAGPSNKSTDKAQPTTRKSLWTIPGKYVGRLVPGVDKPLTDVQKRQLVVTKMLRRASLNQLRQMRENPQDFDFEVQDEMVTLPSMFDTRKPKPALTGRERRGTPTSRHRDVILPGIPAARIVSAARTRPASGVAPMDDAIEEIPRYELQDVEPAAGTEVLTWQRDHPQPDCDITHQKPYRYMDKDTVEEWKKESGGVVQVKPSVLGTWRQNIAAANPHTASAKAGSKLVRQWHQCLGKGFNYLPGRLPSREFTYGAEHDRRLELRQRYRDGLPSRTIFHEDGSPYML